MDTRDREALNDERRLGRVETELAHVSLYRGELELGDHGEGTVRQGEGLIVEVYDLCESEVWFELDRWKALELADLIERAAKQ